jgi:RNA polymerase sigma factor (sigma-70 family)
MPNSEFLSTQWSLVLRAGQLDDTQSRDAMASLCDRYWYPLYAFIRNKGVAIEQAEDFTQNFIARLIEKRVLSNAARERGRFRSFLLSSLQNFLANEWDKAKAQKRGGTKLLVSLDWELFESKLRIEPWHALTAERIFDRAWATQLLERVLAQLRQAYHEKGKEAEFSSLEKFLAGKLSDESYAAVGQELGLSQAALRQRVHRLRQTYRRLLRAEVAQTVSCEEEIEDEIHNLFQAFGDAKSRSQLE